MTQKLYKKYFEKGLAIKNFDTNFKQFEYCTMIDKDLWDLKEKLKFNNKEYEEYSRKFSEPTTSLCQICAGNGLLFNCKKEIMELCHICKGSTIW